MLQCWLDLLQKSSHEQSSKDDDSVEFLPVGCSLKGEMAASNRAGQYWFELDNAYTNGVQYE